MCSIFNCITHQFYQPIICITILILLNITYYLLLCILTRWKWTERLYWNCIYCVSVSVSVMYKSRLGLIIIAVGISPASGVGQVCVLEPFIFHTRDYCLGCKHVEHLLHITNLVEDYISHFFRVLPTLILCCWFANFTDATQWTYKTKPEHTLTLREKLPLLLTVIFFIGSGETGDILQILSCILNVILLKELFLGSFRA